MRHLLTRYFTLPIARHRAKVLIVLLFSLPLLASLLMRPQGSAENRYLANFPAAPHSWAETLQYPAKIDLWISDHLGWRNELIGMNNYVRFHLFHQFPTRQLLLGRHGRLLMATYNTVDPVYSGVLAVCGYGSSDDGNAALVAQINLFDATLRAHGLDGRLMIAPTPPLVYREELPGWLQRRCASAQVPMQRALASPQLQGREHIFYPLPDFLAAKQSMAIFPVSWFHWGGDGARLAAELSAQRFWGAQPQAAPELHSTIQRLPSDLSNLMPGVTLDSSVKLVDFAASGVQECHGATCYPELSDVMAKLWGVNRYRHDGAPLPRLVMVTDSYGLQLAPWYARYYRDVVQVATNDLTQLAPEERRRLARFLFQQPGPQDLIFVYHDATVQGGGRIATDLGQLFPPPDAAPAATH